MRNILTLAIIFFSLKCIGQTYSQSDFTEYPIPKVNSDAWLKLDTSSKGSFMVLEVNGQLRITKDSTLAGKEYAISGGRLLALDLGEWGGGLFFKPDDSLRQSFLVNNKPVNVDNQLEHYDWILHNYPVYVRNLIKGKHLLIAGANTQSLVPCKKEWLFTQGMLVGPNHGWLSQLVMQNDSFTVTKLVDLDAAPKVITVYNDKVFVVTDNGFYRISGGKKETVLDNLFWAGLNPNSIAVVDENHIYVGMHCGYAKADLVKREIKFYRYNK
jgi:hypothetical protein